MSKKIRSKKYNKHEARFKLSKAITKNYAIAKCNDCEAEVVDLSNYSRIKLARKCVYDAMVKVPHKWTVGLFVNCTESNGKIKTILDQIAIADRKTQVQISDFMSEQYDELINDCSSKMTVNFAGWIATTQPAFEFDINKVDSLLARIGGYE